MIDYAKYFIEIESMEFAAQVNLVSGFKMFEELATRNICYIMLVVAIRELGPELLFQRIKELVVSEFDYKYENPYDTALAVYIMALNEINHSAAGHAAQISNDAKQIWWTRKVINKIQGLSN
jgi:hypothetical protein